MPYIYIDMEVDCQAYGSNRSPVDVHGGTVLEEGLLLDFSHLKVTALVCISAVLPPVQPEADNPHPLLLSRNEKGDLDPRA